jgi:hypothetical protein
MLHRLRRWFARREKLLPDTTGHLWVDRPGLGRQCARCYAVESDQTAKRADVPQGDSRTHRFRCSGRSVPVAANDRHRTQTSPPTWG